jgi:uncharacterized integral membrane protein
LKVVGILLGLVLILVFACSAVPTFSFNLFGYPITVPNLLSTLGATTLFSVAGFSVTVGILFLAVALLSLLFGFIA